MIRIKDRDSIREKLSEMSIPTGIHYPILLPDLKAYAYQSNLKRELSLDEIKDDLISLPMGDNQTIADIDEVIHALQEILKD